MDDCFFAATRDQEWIQSQVDMLKTAFEELTLERGGGDQYSRNNCPYGEGQSDGRYMQTLQGIGQLKRFTGEASKTLCRWTNLTLQGKRRTRP